MTRVTPAAIVQLTAVDLDVMPMADRCARLIEYREAAGVNGLANLEGVLRFFTERKLGAPGSWISWINAGILESALTGLVYRIGGIPVAAGTRVPGVALWLAHYADVSSGAPAAQRETSLSRAKEVADTYGLALAAQHGIEPTPTERRFLAMTQICNWLRRNPDARDIVTDYARMIDPTFGNRLRMYLTGNLDDVALTREACALAWALATDDR